MIIEYARNVLGFSDAEHAEYDPYASNLFVSRLDCSLVGRDLLHVALLLRRAEGSTGVEPSDRRRSFGQECSGRTSE